MRTGDLKPPARREISRFPYKERLRMPGSLTTPGRPGARDGAPVRLAFRSGYGVGARDDFLSRLNGRPAPSPADASPPASRPTTHGSGPMWFATPSSRRTLTDYSLPVSRRTPIEITTWAPDLQRVGVSPLAPDSLPAHNEFRPGDRPRFRRNLDPERQAHPQGEAVFVESSPLPANSSPVHVAVS